LTASGQTTASNIPRPPLNHLSPLGPWPPRTAPPPGRLAADQSPLQSPCRWWTRSWPTRPSTGSTGLSGLSPSLLLPLIILSYSLLLCWLLPRLPPPGQPWQMQKHRLSRRGTLWLRKCFSLKAKPQDLRRRHHKTPRKRKSRVETFLHCDLVLSWNSVAPRWIPRPEGLFEALLEVEKNTAVCSHSATLTYLKQLSKALLLPSYSILASTSH